MKNNPIQECRFATYCPPPPGYDDDLHIIKELVHYPDGTSKPNVKLIKNFVRTYYTTKKGFQNHQQKKEYEHLSKLELFKSTQSKLNENIARSINYFGPTYDLKQICRSPYVYGTDISSTSLIKHKINSRHPDLFTKYSLAVYDIETDVVNEDGSIIIATMSFKDKVFTGVLKSFVDGIVDPIPKLQKMFEKYLGKYKEERNINWEVKLLNNEAEIVNECFKKAHEWRPDIVTVWNINFDIPKSVEALKKYNYDPAITFSDPIVPHDYKYFKYIEGRSRKEMASGKSMPLQYHQRWHRALCPASFKLLDAMCVYKQIRISKPEEKSYALDYLLDKNLGIRKLTFEAADHLTGLNKHIFMQTHYKLEYIIYNVFDCISVECLDEKTLDLCWVLPLNAGYTDFENFKSQPKKLIDDLHFFYMERDKVIGSTSDQMYTELDKMTLSPEDWIGILAPHLLTNEGCSIIEGCENMPTSVYVQVADLDVKAAYPNAGGCFNTSVATTKKELCAIEGVPEIMVKHHGINLSGGRVNAVEFCTLVLKTPKFHTLLEHYKQINLS